MSFYVIGIGGTGAKCVEAIIHLAAVGLIPTDKLQILFVDSDENNGNLERTQASLGFYQDCYGLLGGNREECKWMTTNIQAHPVWSPFSQTSTDKKLGPFFYYKTLKQNNPSLANLFDVLYTKDERDVPLDVGFRGRPAIGAAIMTRIDLERLDEEPWRSFINEITSGTGGGSQPKVLLCGSIFGGTGASGLPTIGRLIANKLEDEGIRQKVQLGCVFILPYFNFPASSSEETVYARSELFLLNTEAALLYYEEQARQFDTKYLIGNQVLEQVKFSIGKNRQRNRPHFIEFYAALAAHHFFSQPSHQAVHLISRNKMGILQWSDLPESTTIKQELVNAVRFAFIWLSDFEGELKSAKKSGIGTLDHFSWFQKFFQGRGFFGRPIRTHLPDLSDAQQQEAIKIINDWCRDFLRWLSDIHQCEKEKIVLFKAKENFQNLEQLKNYQLSNLFFEDLRAKNLLEQDNAVALKNRLGDINIEDFSAPNQGTAGLAKALYICCRV